MTHKALHRQLKTENTYLLGQSHVEFNKQCHGSKDPKADLITYTDINTGTSCNSGKASQFMTPSKNSAASTSSTTSRVGLSSFIAKKKTTHLHQKFVGKLKQYIVTILTNLVNILEIFFN
jgi:hypothetical protein